MIKKMLPPLLLFMVLILCSYCLGCLAESSFNLAEWGSSFRRTFWINAGLVSLFVAAIIAILNEQPK